MAVSIFTIAALFSGEEKLIKKGENALKSGRLQKFSFDGTAGGLLADVKASMKDKVYKVKVNMHSINTVLCIHCCAKLHLCQISIYLIYM